MKNPIIAELWRLRDARAQRYNFDVEAMARELATLAPWMERKTYTLRHGRMVRVASLREGKGRRTAVRTPTAPRRK
ncbi:MAG: hypothetical protein FJ403_00915 [Verrucomicrobia bacterium]|nr:hypothetical protein [Verrucomicrobiota bacterium]